MKELGQAVVLRQSWKILCRLSTAFMPILLCFDLVWPID